MLNFTPGSIFGIDKNVWYVAERFQGVRKVPPGLHFIFYSFADKNGRSTIRRGFFEYLESNKVYPIVWSPENEDIRMDISCDDVERLEFRWKEDKNITIEYPGSSFHAWLRLTHYVTKSTVSRLGLGKQRIFIGPEFDIVSSKLEKETEAEIRLRKQLNKNEDDSNVSLKFSVIPLVDHPSDCSGRALTDHYLDRTATLEHLAQNFLNCNFFGSELLGELQLAFLTFVFGGGGFIVFSQPTKGLNSGSRF